MRNSEDDGAFLAAFEACGIPPAAFDHRAHLRLAYACLCESAGNLPLAHSRVRAALQAFIRHNGVPESKYHETITQAWILAVDYFMRKAPAPFDSFDAFIAADPRLLDPAIMLTHYSKERLFSEQARTRFIGPDLEEIPD